MFFISKLEIMCSKSYNKSVHLLQNIRFWNFFENWTKENKRRQF